MPKLTTPEGELSAEEVEKQFAKSMAAPEPDEPPAPAPARTDEGQEQPAAAAPSDVKHAKPRTRAPGGGRGRRTTKAKTAAPATPEEGHYVQPIGEFLESLRIVGALAPMPPGPLTTRVRLQGQLIGDHAPGLATALDAAARHNAVIRRGVEALTMGSAGWILPAVLAVAPFAASSAALWRQPVSDEDTAAAAAFETQVRSELQAMVQAAGTDARPAA